MLQQTVTGAFNLLVQVAIPGERVEVRSRTLLAWQSRHQPQRVPHDQQEWCSTLLILSMPNPAARVSYDPLFATFVSILEVPASECICTSPGT